MIVKKRKGKHAKKKPVSGKAAGKREVPRAGEAVSDEERLLLTVNARAAALGWLNSFLAASKDPERFSFYRTLSLEFFETGLQLIGCDGTALFRTWVGSGEDSVWPETDEAPVHSVVAMDSDQFGVSYMKALLQVTSQKGKEHEELTITTAPWDDGDTPALGEEFRTERLVLRALGQRLDLRLMEGSYPNWRQLQFGVTPVERVDGLTIAPRILKMVGNLKEVTGIDLAFRGDTKAIDFVARGGGQIQALGLLMPMMRPEKKKATESDQVEEELDEE